MDHLQDYLYILRSRHFSELTIRLYGTKIKEFNDYCLSHGLSQYHLDGVLSKQYYSYLKSKYNAGNINTALTSLRGYFNYLVTKELIVYNFFNSLHNYFTQTHPPRSIPFSQLKQILDGIDDGQFHSLRDIAVFELIYGSGIRSGELINLIDTDLDLSNEEIHVKTRKVRRWETRTVYLPAGTVYILKKYLTYKRMRWPTSKYIFPKQNGKKYNSNFANRIVKLMLGKENGSKVLRNTYIQILISNGADVTYIKELIGYSTSHALMKFNHSEYSLRQIYESSFPRERKYLQQHTSSS